MLLSSKDSGPYDVKTDFLRNHVSALRSNFLGTGVQTQGSQAICEHSSKVPSQACVSPTGTFLNLTATPGGMHIHALTIFNLPCPKR